jgi:hypothetical protein
MPARWRAPARLNDGGGPHLRAWSVALLIPLIATLLVHAASAADPPPAARGWDRADARQAGVALELVLHPELPSRVLEVRPEVGSTLVGIVLEAASDGAAVAMVDTLADPAAGLLLARADGSQLRIEFDGVLDATFAADATSLAVVDGVGRLWRVDATSGAAQVVADGPFIRAPVVQNDGSILALAVPSIEAPFRSQLTSVATDGGQQPASDESLVYDAALLGDGSLAVVAHRPAGTVVLRHAGDAATLHADLGRDAVNVSLSADGSVIAWESAGEVFVRGAGGATHGIGPGSSPRLTGDGGAVLIERDGRSVLLDLEGGVLATMPAATVIGCRGGCAS